jgi:hypothetical protein
MGHLWLKITEYLVFIKIFEFNMVAPAMQRNMKLSESLVIIR